MVFQLLASLIIKGQFFNKDPQLFELFDESKFFGPVLELPFKCLFVGKFTEHIHDNCSSMFTKFLLCQTNCQPQRVISRYPKKMPYTFEH